MHAHHAVEENGSPMEKVERQHLLADLPYEAVIDYQLVKAGRSPSNIQ